MTDMSWLDMILGRGNPMAGGPARGDSGGLIEGAATPGTHAGAATPDSDITSMYRMLYDNPEFRAQSMRSGLMGLASGLLKAGGQSAQPVGFGAALGQGIEGMQGGMDKAEDGFTKRLMLGSSFEKNRADAAREKMWSDMWSRQLGGAGPAAGGVAAPGVSPAPAGPQTAGGAPHPNNPGNLISGPNGFQAFATPEEGVAALAKNLLSYPGQFNGGRPMTLAQIAARWAPADDGRNPMLRGNNPQAWAAAVGQIAGIRPDQPVDLSNPQVLAAVTRGIHGIEKGRGAAYSPEVYQRGLQAQAPQAPPPRVSSPADLAAMPSGTRFTAPDGSVRVKP